MRTNPKKCKQCKYYKNFDGRMCYCAPFEEKEDIEDEDSILVER
jgi:hypothetical protein